MAIGHIQELRSIAVMRARYTTRIPALCLRKLLVRLRGPAFGRGRGTRNSPKNEVDGRRMEIAECPHVCLLKAAQVAICDDGARARAAINLRRQIADGAEGGSQRQHPFDQGSSGILAENDSMHWQAR